MPESRERRPPLVATSARRRRACRRTRAWRTLACATLALAGVAAAAVTGTDAMGRSVARFAERVVLPAHEELVAATGRLVEAAEAFERAPDDATLGAFRRARLRAAAAWAGGRAFAFGPMHSLGLDAAIESPIDAAGIDLTIGSLGDASVADLERRRLTPSLTGLEAIDHLLHPDDDDPEAFTPPARRYLHALARRVDRAAGELLDVWRRGHDGHPAFATVLATAGEPDNRAYRSVASAAEEIVRGLIGCLDVVVDEELPALIAAADTSAGDAGTASLALLHATLGGAADAYRGAAIDTWLGADDRADGPAVSRALDSASVAVAVAAANADDVTASRAALERAAGALDDALELLDERVLPLTRSGDATKP